MKDPKYSPWGKVQYVKSFSEGVVLVSTASHGGMKLDRACNAKVPASARRKGGWYEEDCEVAIPILTFPELFPKDQEAAQETIDRWFPEFKDLWR